MKTGIYVAAPSVLEKAAARSHPSTKKSNTMASPYSKYIFKGDILLTENGDQMTIENGEFLLYE